MVEPIMNENEFELDGKVYVAADRKNKPGAGCIGCSMDEIKICPLTHKSDLVPNCDPAMRKDMRDVIFVEKHK